MKIKERSINYDVIRILMSFFVIAVHVNRPVAIAGNLLINNALVCLLMACNGVFYMVSGKFNLSKRFEDKLDYIKYYKSKFISIVVPYGIATAIIVWSEHQFESNILKYIIKFIEAICNVNPTTHMWFMNVLIGLLLSAPFIAKLLQNMKDWELKILVGIGFGWNFISIYLVKDFGYNFPVSGWLLENWLFLFVLGYACDRLITANNVKFIYLGGFFGYIISVLGLTYLPIFENANDLSVGFILYIMAVYLALQRNVRCDNVIIKRVVSFIAAHSFLAYMLHIVILNQCRKYIDPSISMMNYVLCIVLDFAISYAISIMVTWLIIKPIQKLSRIVLRMN